VTATAEASADTITALASPAGRSARAILRLSGPRAICIAAGLFRPAPDARPGLPPGFSCTEGRLAGWGIPARLYLMRAPRSYTREDVVELHLPGNPLVAEAALRRTLELGARLAGPGEFTRRAVAHGRLSPDQAASVIALIRAGSRAELAAAAGELAGGAGQAIAGWLEEAADLAADMEAELDLGEAPGEFLDDSAAARRLEALATGLDRLFPPDAAENELPDPGRIRVALAGPVNAGKSLLFRRLTGREALVSAVPGTTRDVLEAPLLEAPDDVSVLDTPGLGAPPGEVELLARAAAEHAWRSAELLLLVSDRAAPPEASALDGALGAARAADIPVFAVRNKCDLPAAPGAADFIPPGVNCLGRADVSALSGDGCAALAGRIAEVVRSGAVPRTQAHAALTARRSEVVREAAARLDRARRALADGLGLACAADDLGAAVRTAARHFRPAAGGWELDQELLDRIFARFCVGK
jgi:tRNA modification GTPase